MKVNKFHDKSLKENRIDIYYNNVDGKLKYLFNFLEKCNSIEGFAHNTKKMISLNDIFYFEIVDRKCFAYLEKEVYEVNISLRDIENNYSDKYFIRISKSVVLNILKIDYLKADLYMRVKAYLVNGECLIINRTYKNSFFKNMESLRKESASDEINK